MTRGRVVILTAIATLAVAILVAVLDRSANAGESTPVARYSGNATIHWRTFYSQSFRFTVRYPTVWRAADYTKVGTFYAAVAYLSDQPMAAPCRTSDHGSRVECGDAVTHVATGGVSVVWSNESSTRPHLFEESPGTPTTIGGVPARVLIGTDDNCTDLGGRTSVTATVRRPDAGADNVFVMDACVAAGEHSRQVALVLASLRSMRQT